MTGAGRGIGRSIALCLAREGVRVVVVSRRARDLNTLVEDMGGAQAGHLSVPLDLMSTGAPTRLMKRLKALDVSPIDIVIHNLGGTLEISDPFCPVSDWRKVWRFNLEVAIDLNVRLLPSMRRRRWGRVVHISSIASMENHGPVTYCAVKAALTAYARSLGRVLASEGVVVTAVLPGAIFTKGGYWDLAAQTRPDHVKQYLQERMASHRFGQPDEIGSAVAFLCSEQASFFIGSIVPIDGGQGRGYFGQS